MADTKISALPASTTPLAGTEVLPIVQGGATKQVSVANLTAGRDVSTQAITATGVASLSVGAVIGNGTFAASKIYASAANGLIIASKTGTANDFLLTAPNGNSVATIPTGTENLSLVNNLVIGTSGKGIDFSATSSGSGTMTSELLADYEEGTWTPGVYGSGTPGTYTLSNVLAYYTKVGNQVTVWAQFGFSAATGGTDNVRISGLPFNYKASSAIIGTLSMQNVDTTTTSPLGMAVRNTSSASTDIIYPQLLIDNAPFEQIPISGVSASSEIAFTVTYTV